MGQANRILELLIDQAQSDIETEMPRAARIFAEVAAKLEPKPPAQ